MDHPAPAPRSHRDPRSALSGLEFRWTTAADTDAVRACLEEVTAQMLDTSTFAVRFDDEVVERVCAGQVLCAVAADGTVVGMGVVFVAGPGTEYDQVFSTLLGAGPAAQLGWLAVRPSHRRLGVASRLVEGRVERARVLGHRLLVATVAPTNTASLKNLTNHGFEVRGRTRMYGGSDRLVLSRRT